MRLSKKDKKAKGRIYNKIYDPENGAYNTQDWDDWNDHRDGQRNGNIDKTLKPVENYSQCRWGCQDTKHKNKLKKLLNRRKEKKLSLKNKK